MKAAGAGGHVPFGGYLNLATELFDGINVKVDFALTNRASTEDGH